MAGDSKTARNTLEIPGGEGVNRKSLPSETSLANCSYDYLMTKTYHGHLFNIFFIENEFYFLLSYSLLFDTIGILLRVRPETCS